MLSVASVASVIDMSCGPETTYALHCFGCAVRHSDTIRIHQCLSATCIVPAAYFFYYCYTSVMLKQEKWASYAALLESSGVIKLEGKALNVLCCDTLSRLKEYSMCQHYKIEYSSHYSQLSGN